MEDNTWMVYVSCMTYNHAPYIKDALDGFCMQKTSFPFVCGVIDDASTDGEPEVLRDYLEEHFDLDDNTIVRRDKTDDYELIFARHKENRNCYFVVVWLKYNHYSTRKTKRSYVSEWRDNAKYLAICEGDDYWIVPNKLQIQVDFLEEHLDHSMCIHAYRCDIYKGDDIISKNQHKYDKDIIIVPPKEIIANKKMFCATASKMIRTKSLVDYPQWALKATSVGDKQQKLVLFARGHIAYIDKVMCVYRLGVVGSWTNRTSADREYLHRTRKELLQINKDFDIWTNRRYHNLVRQANLILLWSFVKTDIKSLIYNITR